MNSTKIGVLGGGQLGRMMQEAAHRLNVTMVVLDEDSASPAKQVTSQHAAGGSFACADDVRSFARAEGVQVLTVEIEHVDCDTLDELTRAEDGAKGRAIRVCPSTFTLRTIQDKFAQKQHFLAANLPVADSVAVPTAEALVAVAENGTGDFGAFGWPIMLKRRRWAYDGRGNCVVRSAADAADAFASLNPEQKSDALYMEKWVPFVRELAIMVVRDADGHVAAYPVTETVHKRNICHVTVAPAQIDGRVSERAREIATSAVASFSGAGIFGVEMFHLDDDTLLINEIAPRPHNSGHYTIEACHTSQFENHVRVVAGLPMGDTSLKVPYAAMVNLLGAADAEMQTTLRAAHVAMRVQGATLHLYGKKQCKVDRKMGHITVVANTFPELRSRMALILAAMDPERPTNISEVDVTPALRRPAPLVGIIMGSDSDLPVMKAAAQFLEEFDVPFEVTIVSAHRTPQRMFEYARSAHARGIQVIIAGAGGAAHLPGMVAAITPLPVIGVPVALKVLDGQDSLMSIVQMPRGVPVATVAINNSTNAGLLAVRILAATRPFYLEKMVQYQERIESEMLHKVERLEKIGWKMY